MLITSQNVSFTAANGEKAYCHRIFVNGKGLCSSYEPRCEYVKEWLLKNVPQCIQSQPSDYEKTSLIISWLNADRQRRQDFNRIRGV